jgi:heptaprenyl diphosphate synthase
MKNQKLAYLIACGCALQITESLFPHPVPGLRLGLANLIVLIVLNLYGIKDAVIVSVLRPLLSSFYLGTFLTPSFFLSFFSSVFSCLVMCFVFLMTKTIFSNIGLSIIGAITHNFSQLFFAYILFIRHTGIFVFLPVLILGGIFSGYITGWSANYIIPEMKKLSVNNPSIEVEEEIQIESKVWIKFFTGIFLILLIIIARDEKWFLILSAVSFIFGLGFGFDFKKFFNKLKILWIILLFSLIVHLFFTPGDIIFKVGFLKITQQGLLNSFIMITRVVLLVFVSDVIVYRISIKDLFAIFKRLPLSNLFYLISAVFGFLPSILDRIRNTQPKTLKNLLNSLLVV